MFKLAAFDIDGTILNSKSEISQENTDAIKRAKELGVKIILATGKHYLSAQSLYDLLDLKEPQVSCNGAIIYCPINKQVIKTSPLNQEVYLEIMDRLSKTDIATVVYTNKGFFTTFPEKAIKDIISVGETKISYVDDYSNLNNIVKVLCVLPEHKTEEESMIRNMENSHVSVVRTSELFLEFVAPASNKALAIKYIADKYNISKEEIIAFGDSENDVEMLKFAGLGVCMENGSDIAKESSDVVVSNNDSHGVKEGLYKYLFKE